MDQPADNLGKASGRVGSKAIALIGYRGSGKSTVGQALAAALGWAFVDTDAEIIKTAGQSIRAIFEQLGESAFRNLESQTLQSLEGRTALVISCGGGILLREANQQLLQRTADCVWLRAPAAELWRRINDDAISHHHRPPLTDHEGIAEVDHLLAVREPTYAAIAALTVDVEGRTVEKIVEEILAWHAG